MNKLEITKRDIIVGTICSVIAGGIIGIFGQLQNAVPAIGATILSTFKNLIYSLAATSGPNVLLLFLTAFFLGGMIITFFHVVRFLILDLLVESKKSTIRNEDNGDNTEKKSKRKPNGILKSFNESKIKLIIEGIFVLVYTAFFTVVVLLIPAGLSDSFGRDIQYIRPYVDEEVVIKLQSDWVVMRSEDDYKAIYSVINKVKDEHLEKR